MKKIELQIGEKYNYWTILALSDFVSKKGERYYKCQCNCGTIRDVRAYHLKNGKSKSCGCFVREPMSNLKRISVTFVTKEWLLTLILLLEIKSKLD